MWLWVACYNLRNSTHCWWTLMARIHFKELTPIERSYDKTRSAAWRKREACCVAAMGRVVQGYVYSSSQTNVRISHVTLMPMIDFMPRWNVNCRVSRSWTSLKEMQTFRIQNYKDTSLHKQAFLLFWWVLIDYRYRFGLFATCRHQSCWPIIYCRRTVFVFCVFHKKQYFVVEYTIFALKQNSQR